MVDLHSHILPEMDDGSQSVEMSHKMLELMAQQQVHTVVATPHFYASRDLPEAFLERRKKCFQALGPQKPGHPQVILGAEVAYFDGMGRNAEVLEQLQIGNSGLLLVEMPFAQWTNRMVREVCDLPLQTGLTPVLAHVDRYCSNDRLYGHMETLLDCGVLFQCNADAFLSFFRRMSIGKLLRYEAIHFLGSDSHNLSSRMPNLGEAAQVIRQKWGDRLLSQIMDFSREQLKEPG